MPFVLLCENADWGDEEDEANPSAEHYQYLTPLEFGGASEPVVYQEGDSLQKPSWLTRIGESNYGTSVPAEDAEQSATMMGLIGPALRAMGGQRVRCTCNGRDNESFAQLRTLELADRSLTVDEIVDHLADSDLPQQLAEAKLISAPVDSSSLRESSFTSAWPMPGLYSYWDLATGQASTRCREPESKFSSIGVSIMRSRSPSVDRFVGETAGSAARVTHADRRVRVATSGRRRVGVNIGVDHQTGSVGPDVCRHDEGRDAWQILLDWRIRIERSGNEALLSQA